MATIEELSNALINADKAGDADAAKMLAAEITRMRSTTPEKQSTGMDMLKSAGSGVAQGAMDLVGLPGTIGDLVQTGLTKGINKGANLLGAEGDVLAPLPQSPVSGGGIREGASALTGGATEYKPETTAGKYAQTAGAFIPGALMGPGGPVKNAIQYGVIPGLASEAAGQATEGTAYEPYARMGAGIAAGMIGPAARALVPRREDVSLSEIGKAAAADNLTPQQMYQRLDDLGPQSMVADLGPNLQGQTGAMANLPGAQNQTIRTALNDRQAGANARLDQSIEQNLGPRVIPSEIKDTISDGQRVVGQQYPVVMQGATRVDTEPLANRLDAALANLRGPERNAMNQVRGYLNIPGSNVLDPNPQALHSTREAIDGMLNTEQNPQVIRALTDARREVDDVLAVAAPGIKDVDAQYHELARQAGTGNTIGGGLSEGQRVLDSGRTAPRPEELAATMAEGAIPQGNMIGPSGASFRIRQGTRADIDRIVGNNRNDIVAMDRLIKGEGDWNPQKLRTLFGDDRANQLMRVLENEKAYAATRNESLGNSVSANRLQFMSKYSGGKNGMNISDYYGAGGVMGALRGVGVKAARALAGKFIDARQEGINAEIAKNLTGRKDVVDALVRSSAQGSRLAGPARTALIQALLDQRRQLESQ